MAAEKINLPLEVLLDDVLGCMAFYDFMERYHAAENLQFWMSVEAFRNRNWKAAKILGINSGQGDLKNEAAKAAQIKEAEKKAEEAKKQRSFSRRLSKKRMSKRQMKETEESTFFEEEPDPELERALKREKEEAKAARLQKKIDENAAQRIGISLEQLYLVKEADYIFETFIRPGAPSWVCIDHREALIIEEKLANFRSLKRNVFDQAQDGIFNGMAEDLLPRFLKEIMETGSNKPGAKQKSKESQELRSHLEVLAKRRRRKTGFTTAIAFGFGRRGSSAGKTSNDEIGKMKSLRMKHSQLVFLQRESSVGALPLSRSLLSMKADTIREDESQEGKASSSGSKPAPSSRLIGSRGKSKEKLTASESIKKQSSLGAESKASRLRLSLRSAGSSSSRRSRPIRRSSMNTLSSPGMGTRARCQSDTIVSSAYDPKGSLPIAEATRNRGMSLGGRDFDSSGLAFRPRLFTEQDGI